MEDFLDKMGYKRRGVRSGDGPYEDSWQRENVGKGRRIEAGEECPITKEDIKEVKFFK